MGAINTTVIMCIFLVSIKSLHAERGLLSPVPEEPDKKSGNATTILTPSVKTSKQNTSLLEGTIQDENLDFPVSSQKDIPETETQTVIHPRLVRSYSQMRYDRGRGGFGWGGGYGYGGGYGFGRPYRPPFGGYGFYGPYRPRPALVIVG